MPAPPIPAITRPTIIAFMFGAAPQRALPDYTSNTEVLDLE
jgi:hypothetical protein